MPICKQCGKEHTGDTGCPDCDGAPAMYGPEHDLRLVSVYRAEDEMTAHLIHGALVNNGVPAHIHSEQASMFGAILRPDHGCWGEVMVPQAYTERALDIVHVFTTQPIPDGDDDPPFEDDPIPADAAPLENDPIPADATTDNDRAPAAVSVRPAVKESPSPIADSESRPQADSEDLSQTVQPAAPTAGLRNTVPLDAGEKGPDLVPFSTQSPGPDRPGNDPPA